VIACPKRRYKLRFFENRLLRKIHLKLVNPDNWGKAARITDQGKERVNWMVLDLLT
jgi:hypothetical protein